MTITPAHTDTSGSGQDRRRYNRKLEGKGNTMHDRTRIDGGDLDRHITQYPDGIPAEKLEEAAEDALKWWAAGHTLTQLQTLLADAEDEMARAYVETGGDAEDAPKFEELRAACERLEALVRPSDCAYFARSILQEANASLAFQTAQHKERE